MSITVLMPVYNAGPDLRPAMESVVNQTCRDFEFLVIDDNSTDGSRRVLEEYASRDSRIRVVCHDQNRGLAATLNEGLNLAQNDLVARMDQDDESLPERLAVQSDYMSKHAGIVLAGSYAYHMGATPADDTYVDLPVTPEAIKARLLEVNCIYHPSVIMRRQEVLAAGGYREEFRNTEDYDLWLRMSRTHSLANIPKPLIRFRLSVNGMTLGRKWEQFYYTKLAVYSHRYPDIPLAELGKAVREELEQVDRKEYLKSAYAGAISEFVQLKLWDNAWFLARKAVREIGALDGIGMMAEIGRRRAREKQELRDISKTVERCKPASRGEKAPHILFALPYMVIGGADTVIIKVAEYLKERGYSCSFVTTLKVDNGSFGDNTPKYELLSKEIYNLNNLFEYSEDWRDFVFYLIESRRVDLIFNVGSEFMYNMLPEIAARYPHVRVIDQQFNEHGHLANNRRNARHIDLTVVSNDVIRAVLETGYYETPEKIRTIIHGVDTRSEFNPASIEDSPEALSSIPRGTFTVAFFGRFSEEKAPGSFVHIAHEFRDDDDVSFLMIGNGPEFEQIRQKASHLGLSRKIFMPGFVDDPKPFMKAADVVIIPSRIEGIPITLLESLSMGIPVVASAVGGIPSVITDGVNGFLRESDDLDGFVQAVKRLRDDGVLRETISRKAREYAVNNIDIQRMNADYYDAIQNVLREN